MDAALDLTLYLPTTRKELDLRGWDEADIILFSGDAYIDHPAFGAAVIGRVLEHAGYRVAIVPQPDWHGDWRDFKKLGRPRLFFAITSGSMDSMVNHYTAAKRLRSDDAYTPEGRAGMRPDYCVTVYCSILKQLFPDVPIVIGGIEASMRRLTHYDYWSDSLKPSLLIDSKADLLVYGMGERQVVEAAHRLEKGEDWHTIPQTAWLSREPVTMTDDVITLHSHEQALRNKRCHAENFRCIETESNRIHPKTLVQAVGHDYVVVNPTYDTMTTEQLDAIYDLPFQYRPHPKYKGKRIPAYEMIQFSVCTHRGCFGGCSFCTISAHQGKQITSRSPESILRQINRLKQLDEWRGYISDLGGPSANMYGMRGKNMNLCHQCARPSCLQPHICKNLNVDFQPILDLWQRVDALPYVKKSFVSSGIRYDLMSDEYGRQLIEHHVSGRLKVAPEHCCDEVLMLMRKPSWSRYEQFWHFFEKVNQEAGLRQQLIPYFISSHPGCTNAHMRQLAHLTARMHYRPEQVQDFTPTPMTLATTIFYCGINPYTMQSVYVARDVEQKRKQNSFFFLWKHKQ